ncbi:kinase-like domain-containing protein [Podospora conica]|nr:kinase-like domain-containing protein [Schizothecium conicum]
MEPPRRKDPTELFREAITGSLWENDGESRASFLPHTMLNELATEEKVSEILEHHLSQLKLDFPASDTSSKSFIRDLTSFIVPDSVKIFLTLVMVEKPWLIESFRLNGGHRDTALPGSISGSARNQQILVGDRAVSTRPPWTPGNVEFFHVQQWKFIAPIFKTGQFRYDSPFSKSAILPYVQYEPQDGSDYNSKESVEKKRKGSYGSVEHRVIHADHMELLPNQITTRDKNNHHRVAVKRFDSSPKAKIINEAQNLERIRDLVKSDYIIKAIAFYEQDGQCHLVFPWAERGTLQELWGHSDYEDGSVRLGEGFVGWFFQQLSGVTDAVARLHEQRIRHGDLKPQNILCFPDTSQSSIPIRLVITDIGTAKQHAISTEERRYKNIGTTTTVSTVRYEAPELKNNDIDTLSEKPKTTKQLSRTFDVWSLGCIWTEFVIWLLYGYMDGYDKFNTATEGNQFWRDTKGYDVVKDVRVTDHVNHWLDQVENLDGRCGTTTALGGLVSLIRKRLLIVEVEALHKPDGESAVTAQSLTTSFTPPSTPLSARRRLLQWPIMSSRRRSGSTVSRPPTADTTDKQVVYRATADKAASELKEITRQLKCKEIKAAGEKDPQFTIIPTLPASAPPVPVPVDQPRYEPGRNGNSVFELFRRRGAR